MDEKITKLETENKNLVSEKTALEEKHQNLQNDHQKLKAEHANALEDIRQRQEWKRKYNKRQKLGYNY